MKFWRFAQIYIVVLSFMISFQITKTFLPFNIFILFTVLFSLIIKRMFDLVSLVKFRHSLLEKDLTHLIKKDVFEQKKKEDSIFSHIEEFEKHCSYIYEKEYRYGLICGTSLMFFNLFLFNHFFLSVIFLATVLLEFKIYHDARIHACLLSEDLEDIKGNDEHNKD